MVFDVNDIAGTILGAGKIEISKRLEPLYDWLASSDAGKELVKMYSKTSGLAMPVVALISHVLESYHKGDNDLLEGVTDLLSDGVSEIYSRLDRAAKDLGSDDTTVQEAKDFIHQLFIDVSGPNCEAVIKYLARLSYTERTALLGLLSGFQDTALRRVAKSPTSGRNPLLAQLVKIAQEDQQAQNGAKRAAAIDRENETAERRRQIERAVRHSSNKLANRLAGRS